MFIRRTDANFTVHNEPAVLCSLKDTSTGEDFFLEVQKALASLELSWEELKSVTTDDRENVWVLRPVKQAEFARKRCTLVLKLQWCFTASFIGMQYAAKFCQ
jgi:hypothetical protein